MFCVRSRSGGNRGTKWFCCSLVPSLSTPTIRYWTSSTELFSFFQSWNEDDEGSSASVRPVFLLRLHPPDDAVEVNLGVTMDTIAGGIVGVFLLNRYGGTVLLVRLVVVAVVVEVVVVVVAVVLVLMSDASERSDGSS